MDSNYQKISSNMLKGLPSRVKEVVSRRFGLEGGERETLEAIGKRLGVTRERVRQIEEFGLNKIRPQISDYQKVFQSFEDYIAKNGGLKKEDVLLRNLGGERCQSQVFFFLSLDKRFEKIITFLCS